MNCSGTSVIPDLTEDLSHFERSREVSPREAVGREISPFRHCVLSVEMTASLIAFYGGGVRAGAVGLSVDDCAAALRDGKMQLRARTAATL